MRNAAATFDEFDDAPVSRKGAARKPRASTAAGRRKKAKRPRFDTHRIARYAAIGMAATMAVGIMVNALMLQKGHHPAPLFGKSAALSAVAMKPVAPLPPPRSASIADATEPAPAKSAPLPREASARDDTGLNSSTDAIGRMIAGGPAQAAGKGDAKSEGRTVLGVQKALTKLGFKVPATGTAGPATRKAIEAFEKDRHMPVKGDMSRRVVKVLSAESGIKID